MKLAEQRRQGARMAVVAILLGSCHEDRGVAQDVSTLSQIIEMRDALECYRELYAVTPWH
jgi:hypothetical protein